MKNATVNEEIFRAALRTQELRIQEILDSIEKKDTNVDIVAHQVRLVEESLRRLRRAA
jgi:hypothetical protein